MQRFTLDRADLGALIDALRAAGFQVVGPTLDSEIIRFGPITSVADLPAGWTMELGPGTARLEHRDDEALFGYVVAPNGLKEYLFPPRRTVWRAVQENGTIRFVTEDDPPAPVAVIGARGCDLAAMGVQDRVLGGGLYRDPDYLHRRETTFVVAVACTGAQPTCFCTSMGTGPAPGPGFDLAITEVIDDGRHIFVGEIGTDAGASTIASIPHRPSTVEEITAARLAVMRATDGIATTLQTDGLHDLLADNQMSGRWNVIAKRCLACGNCTQVCPTCFCVSTEESSSLDGAEAAKTRRWDSCFSLDFSYMGGHPVRASIGARYRQWLTHKLSWWVDQFGESGCVGCGRCIAWCPVGIDLTEEVHALRITESNHA